VVTPARASNATNVNIATPNAVVLVGTPKLDITYSGNPGSGTGPTWVFAQLVDPVSGTVVGNQITPIPVTLDGKQHTTSVGLEDIAFTTSASGHLVLQLVATTVAYAPPHLGGSVHFDNIKIALPVAADLEPK
jgi:ABC-2 type transport system ATP-binding protein